jgi:large subunit ribosomal protein L3
VNPAGGGEFDLNRGPFFCFIMMQALLGTKVKQTQVFTQEGARIPVTLIQAGPCWVTRIEDNQTHTQVQLGYGQIKRNTKPEEGHLKKAGLDNKKLRFLRSFKVKTTGEALKPGQEIKIGDVFQVGDEISVVGTSKGKGFAGVVKRHHFRGGPRTHGQSDRERAPGSIGQTTTPGRVYRGKRMAGRMGTDRVTVRGLKVVGVDPENNVLTVKGLVPGPKQGLLEIYKKV